MMMIRRISLLLFLLPASYNIAAQDNDFGIWLEMNVSHKLAKKFEAVVEGELRTSDNSSQIQQIIGEGGLEYAISKRLSVAGNYRLISRREDDGYFYWRHKIYADLKLKCPAGYFTLYGRLRLQRSTKTYIEDEEDLNALYVWRFRLKTAYDIPGLPLRPWLYYESFSPGFSSSGFNISKYRISPGIELKLTQKSDIQAGYIFQHDTEPKLKNKHVLTVGYGLKF
ncbi:MAG: DUF2490 domain-containing protein [Bacteroidales bacterium]